jgi:hypothetical protein
MGNGEDSGVWGSITNTNWNLMEQAVSGVQTITMTNANYTLTNLNGVSDEARNMVLVVQGTNSAIYQVIIPLNQPKVYVVSNQTTGGYAITVGSSTGAIITIPNGVTAQVYTDGTNTYSAQTGSAGNFTVNGNFSATGSESLTGNLSVGGTLNVTGAASFSNTTTALTPVSGDNSTKVATTAFVTTAVTNATGSLGTMSTQNANNVAITGGTINNVTGTNSGLTVGNATNATNATNVISGGTIASNVTGTTQAPGTNNTTIATTAFVSQNAVVSGTIQMWPTNSAPSGYLLCNGAAVSRTTYAALYAIIGTTFGVGDGSTTFNLPNYTNRMPYGTTIGATGGSADAIVVSHTHTATVTDPGHSHSINVVQGGLGGQDSPLRAQAGTQNTDTATTGISVVNSATGVSGTNANLPPYLGINFIIKT